MKMAKLVKSQETTLVSNPNNLDQIDKRLVDEVPYKKNPNIVNVNVNKAKKIAPAKN